MSRPRISDCRRRLWKRHPMLRMGVTITPAIRAAYDRGDILAMQQMILLRLEREMGGPQTVARQRGRRKVLAANARRQ